MEASSKATLDAEQACQVEESKHDEGKKDDEAAENEEATKDLNETKSKQKKRKHEKQHLETEQGRDVESQNKAKSTSGHGALGRQSKLSTSAHAQMTNKIVKKVKKLNFKVSTSEDAEVEDILQLAAVDASASNDITMLLGKLKKAIDLAVARMSSKKALEIHDKSCEVLYTFLLRFFSMHGLPWTEAQENALLNIDSFKRKAKSLRNVSKLDCMRACIHYDVCASIIYFVSKKLPECKESLDKAISDLERNFPHKSKMLVYGKVCHLKSEYFALLQEEQKCISWSERCFEVCFHINSVRRPDEASICNLYGITVVIATRPTSAPLKCLFRKVLDKLLNRSSCMLTSMEDLANSIAVAWFARMLNKKEVFEKMVRKLTELKFPKPTPKLTCVLFNLLYGFHLFSVSKFSALKEKVLIYVSDICWMQTNAYQRLYFLDMIVHSAVSRETNTLDSKDFVLSLVHKAISEAERVRQSDNAVWILRRLCSLIISSSYWYERISEFEKCLAEARRVIGLCVAYDGEWDNAIVELHAIAHYISGIILFRQKKYCEAKENLMMEIELLSKSEISLHVAMVEEAMSNLGHVGSVLHYPEWARFCGVPPGFRTLFEVFHPLPTPYYIEFAS